MLSYEEIMHQLALEASRIQRQATRPLNEEEWQRHLSHTVFAEELRLLTEQLNKPEDDVFVDPNGVDTRVRPTALDCDVVRFQNNKDKWIAFVGLLDGRPYEIFTGLADDEQGIMLPKSVVKGRIIRAENSDGTHRYDFQFTNSRGFKTTVEGLSYKFDKEYWNYAKLISGVLRYEMPIEQVIKIIGSLTLDNDSINSWTTGVARALKRYVPDGEAESLRGL